MLLQIFFLFIAGLMIGSFLSVAIPRLHDNISGIVTGRSNCPHCKYNLKAIDLIPLFSYLLLKGKCRSCSKSISWFYPVVEVSTGIIFALSLPLIKTLGLNPISLNSQSIILNTDFGLFVFWLFVVSVLIFIYFYDALFYEIDDRVMIPAIVITLLLIAFLPANVVFPDIKSAIFGAIFPLVFFGGQILLSKGRWLGTGDIRIGIFMGLILGWPNILIGLFISYITGSIAGLILGLKKGSIKNIKIPFGPFLSIGTFIAFFFGDIIIEWYLNFLGI